MDIKIIDIAVNVDHVHMFFSTRRNIPSVLLPRKLKEDKAGY
ncbi:hypothetical protein ANME2D_03207 [Candidatus Methanoperedens nitroreducens]|uniref:Transposase IS200-like domain-containing protein n=1 Tax=Candidatus Methanoperedens nitratireducens TaxID=1392998 RepID=A0A062V6Y9_9EURY|nr:hypothetical protein ANME2D_03207 [Candidatus Methanoperedens nitroreducens]